MVVSDTYKKLFHDYINSNSSDYHVSYGTFVALKPLYVRCTISKEIEMCCCKLHLHAQWSVMCMLEIIQKCNIQVEFDLYETFFDYLTKNCASSSTTYIEWSFFFYFFFYANHPLQGFRSHCSVRGYYSLLVATAGAEATTRTGRQHTHAHTHTHSTPNSTLYYLQT